MPDDRETLIRTPLEAGALTFMRLSGEDAIGSCFSFTVGLVSADFDIDPLKLLGAPLSVEVEAAEPKRWISGLVAEFRLVNINGGFAYYAAVLRPWLWLLSRSTDCRIFQGLSVIEIIEQIFAEYSTAKFEKRLQGTYPAREYCVQYDETDLDFVQRLMEHEGIGYFFEYADGAHTLVLFDAMSKLKAAKGYETVPFHFEGEAARRDREYLSQWEPTSELRSGAYAHTDYDFEKPAADLMAQSVQPFAHDAAEGEVYSHPGAHLELARGDAIAAIRREELQAPHVRVVAQGTARGLAAGCVFKLEGFPRADQNVEHLVIRAQYTLIDPEYLTGVDEGGANFHIGLVAAPTAVPFRPPRVTTRRIMRGPQTAVVVGPAGEEIFTDEYARVKVQFHWDRLGKKDENTTCFVRVSQTWAGAGWGFIQIPRIGQEVIVDFIEGDPDKPIITGRVYNAAQMPPYDLPGNATQSGWKSNSSPGGGGWNELRFEDKKGGEQVYFQAEKDHQLLVKNDRAKLVQHDQSDRIDHNAKHSVGVDLDEDVGNNKTTKVGVDRKVEIGNDDTEKVGHDRSLTVGNDESIHVVGSSDEKIDMNHFQTVGLLQKILVKGGRMDQVGLAEVRAIGAYLTLTVGLKRDVKVGTNQTHYVIGSDSWTVGRDETVKIGGNHSIDIGGNQTVKLKGNQDWSNQGGRLVKVGKGQTHDVTEDVWIKAGKSMMLEAADSITLKCGSATIEMKKDGTITVDGKDLTLNGSGKINVKATGEITMNGSKINQN